MPDGQERSEQSRSGAVHAEPLSAYVRRTRGCHDEGPDWLADQIGELEARVEDGSDTQRQRAEVLSAAAPLDTIDGLPGFEQDDGPCGTCKGTARVVGSHVHPCPDCRAGLVRAIEVELLHWEDDLGTSAKQCAERLASITEGYRK